MTDTNSQILTQSESIIKRHSGYVVTISLLILYFASFWISHRNLPQSESSFYWPFEDSLLFWLRCISLPLAVAITLFLIKKNRGRIQGWQFLIVIFLLVLLFVGVLIEYVSIFTADSVTHVGSVQFDDNVFHFARVDKFDEWSIYFIGECEQTRYWCKFDEIFIASPNRIREVSLKRRKRNLQIIFGDEVVYTYDGMQGVCVGGELVYCPSDSP